MSSWLSLLPKAAPRSTASSVRETHSTGRAERSSVQQRQGTRHTAAWQGHPWDSAGSQEQLASSSIRLMCHTMPVSLLLGHTGITLLASSRRQHGRAGGDNYSVNTQISKPSPQRQC